MKNISKVFTIGLTCAITALAASNSFAQDDKADGFRNTGTTASEAIETGKAIASGQSAPLAELLNLSALKQAASIVNTPKSGSINDHEVPGFLKLSPTDIISNGAPTVQDRSSISAIRSPNATISVPGYGNDDNAALGLGRITPPDTNLSLIHL